LFLLRVRKEEMNVNTRKVERITKEEREVQEKTMLS
jgi:hypothetical protein